MDQITHAFDLLLGWVLTFGAICLGIIYQIEAFLRARMTEMGLAANIQTVLLVALTVLLVLILLRIFAPVLRLLLILFLIVLALQLVYPQPIPGPRTEAPCRACSIAT